MRINRYLAESTPLARRAADQAIADGRVGVNGRPAVVGQQVEPGDVIELDGRVVAPAPNLTVMFYKPVGVVCSRRHQGNSQTIYDVLPAELAALNPVGRLDKDTSGLIVLTNDGRLHQKLSHPSQGKLKRYEVELNRTITPEDVAKLGEGVDIGDGLSRPKLKSQSGRRLTIELGEGRYRQVRRTFAALGYSVTKLHRSRIDSLELGSLAEGQWRPLLPEELPQ